MTTLAKSNYCSPSNRVWFDDLLTREMDRFFKGNKNVANAIEASANVWEDDKNLHLEYALPGVKKEQINVQFENGILAVSTEKSSTENDTERNYHRREFTYTSYSRSFRLNDKKYKFDAIEAAFENGVLKVTVPKLVEEKKEARTTIEVK